MGNTLCPPFDREKSAKRWLGVILRDLVDTNSTKETKEAIGSVKNIKKVVSALKNYETNGVDIVIPGTTILRTLSAISAITCTNIIESGCLDYLKDLCLRIWPNRNNKDTTVTNAFCVFLNISCFKATRGELLKESYLQFFLLPFSEPTFSKHNINSAYVLYNLLFIDSGDWIVSPNKDDVEKAV